MKEMCKAVCECNHQGEGVCDKAKDHQDSHVCGFCNRIWYFMPLEEQEAAHQRYERAFFLLAKEKFPDTFKQITEQLGEIPCPTCEGEGGFMAYLGHGDMDSETCTACGRSGKVRYLGSD